MTIVKVDNLAKRKLVFSFFLLIVLSSVVAGYTDNSFSMEVKFSNGGARVTEQSTFSLDTEQERQAFTSSLTLGRSTVSDWRVYSKNIDYHFVGSSVVLNSTEITAKRDFSSVFPAGIVIIEYEVNPDVFYVESTSSRVTSFTFNSSKLKLSRLKSGEVVLGSGARLSFEIPSTALFDRISPKPDSISQGKVVFQGPLASEFHIVFNEEKTLSEEVNEFFTQAMSNTASLVTLILALALVAFIGYKLVAGSQ